MEDNILAENYYGYSNTKQKKVYIKVISNKKVADPSIMRKHLEKEIIIHEKLKNCSYVLNMIDKALTENNIYLIYQNQNYIPLSTYLFYKGMFTEKQIINYIIQIYYGYSQSYSYHVTYRDMTLNNILIGDEDNIKIDDFGMFKFLYNQKNSELKYAITEAPETQKDRKSYIQDKSDSWSLGIILFQLLFLEDPLFQAGQLIIPSTRFLTQQMVDFLYDLLQIDPIKRINWSIILNHPCVQNYIRKQSQKDEWNFQLSCILSPSIVKLTQINSLQNSNAKYYENSDIKERNKNPMLQTFGIPDQIQQNYQSQQKMNQNNLQSTPQTVKTYQQSSQKSKISNQSPYQNPIFNSSAHFKQPIEHMMPISGQIQSGYCLTADFEKFLILANESIMKQSFISNNKKNENSLSYSTTSQIKGIKNESQNQNIQQQNYSNGNNNFNQSGKRQSQQPSTLLNNNQQQIYTSNNNNNQNTFIHQQQNQNIISNKSNNYQNQNQSRLQNQSIKQDQVKQSYQLNQSNRSLISLATDQSQDLSQSINKFEDNKSFKNNTLFNQNDDYNLNNEKLQNQSIFLMQKKKKVEFIKKQKSQMSQNNQINTEQINEQEKKKKSQFSKNKDDELQKIEQQIVNENLRQSFYQQNQNGFPSSKEIQQNSNHQIQSSKNQQPNSQSQIQNDQIVETQKEIKLSQTPSLLESQKKQNVQQDQQLQNHIKEKQIYDKNIEILQRELDKFNLLAQTVERAEDLLQARNNYWVVVNFFIIKRLYLIRKELEEQLEAYVKVDDLLERWEEFCLSPEYRRFMDKLKKQNDSIYESTVSLQKLTQKRIQRLNPAVGSELKKHLPIESSDEYAANFYVHLHLHIVSMREAVNQQQDEAQIELYKHIIQLIDTLLVVEQGLFVNNPDLFSIQAHNQIQMTNNKQNLISYLEEKDEKLQIFLQYYRSMGYDL